MDLVGAAGDLLELTEQRLVREVDALLEELESMGRLVAEGLDHLLGLVLERAHLEALAHQLDLDRVRVRVRAKAWGLG